MTSPKKSRGRQRIEMKRMSKESNLQVTFSKRRSGLFKKASELCTLCGINMALVVFSPGMKVFSFGDPNVDAVIDRFLAREPTSNSSTMQYIEAHRTANVHELNTKLTLMNNQLEEDKNRGEELARVKKLSQALMWWAMPIEEMTRPQLDQYKVELEGMKNHIAVLAANRTGLESTGNLGFFPEVSSSSNLVHQPQPHVMGMGGGGPTAGGFF